MRQGGSTAPLLPARADLLVVGGGTAGAALAGLVARDTPQSVVLLEAGPDYGPLGGGRWPADLLDARRLGLSHDWGYAGLAHPTHRAPTAFERARVIGGCSAHNGCVALLGHRADYDGWARRDNAGWGWDAVARSFARAKEALRVRLVDAAELTPFQAAFVASAAATGIPRVRDLNDPDDTAGVAASPVNIADGIRWNSALAYLDPVRDQDNLAVVGDTLVERVLIERGRAIGVEAVVGGGRARVAADRVVLAAGAYGSPAILLRSGVGPPAELRALGIRPVHALPGVGRGLADHPAVVLRYRGSAALDRAMAGFAATRWLPDEQTLAKARSRYCTEAFDLHLYAVTGQDPATGEWGYSVTVAAMTPRSAGAVTLASADPDAAPRIDHGYLSDPEGRDLAVLVDGVRLAREIMAAGPARDLVAAELSPGPVVRTDAEVADWVRDSIGIYYHPACTCRMGPAGDPLAVVDAAGLVHGLDGLAVCDASIFPTLMRANTNLPAAMVAEHLARAVSRQTAVGRRQ